MNRLTIVAVIVVCGALLLGCATPFPVGSLYTELKLPLGATGEKSGTKVGTAECVSYLSLITTGDASIATAMRNGGITKVSHVDWEVRNILGLVGNYKVIVYGE